MAVINLLVGSPPAGSFGDKYFYSNNPRNSVGDDSRKWPSRGYLSYGGCDRRASVLIGSVL